jgi:hypothetical protein
MRPNRAAQLSCWNADASIECVKRHPRIACLGELLRIGHGLQPLPRQLRSHGERRFDGVKPHLSIGMFKQTEQFPPQIARPSLELFLDHHHLVEQSVEFRMLVPKQCATLIDPDGGETRNEQVHAHLPEIDLLHGQVGTNLPSSNASIMLRADAASGYSF